MLRRPLFRFGQQQLGRSSGQQATSNAAAASGRISAGDIDRRHFSSSSTSRRTFDDPHQQFSRLQSQNQPHQHQSTRSLHRGSALMKGSTPFMKYGATKAKKDNERARIISKFCQSIVKSIREGGSPDPERNPKLAALLKQAVEMQVPKATVDRTLERAKNLKAERIVSCLTGPGDSIFILEGEVTKDIQHKFDRNIRKVITKYDLKGFGKGGPDAIHHFEEKAIMLLLARHSSSDDAEHSLADEEAAETLAIELGAEDVEPCTDDDGNDAFEFIFQPFELNRALKDADERGYDVVKESVEYRPTVLRVLTDEQMDIVKQFYAGMENNELVHNIYDNIAWPSS